MEDYAGSVFPTFAESPRFADHIQSEVRVPPPDSGPDFLEKKPQSGGVWRMQEIPEKQQTAAAGVAFFDGEELCIDPIRNGPNPAMAGTFFHGLRIDRRHREDAVAFAPEPLLEPFHLERPCLQTAPDGRILLDLDTPAQCDITDVNLVQENARTWRDSP